jgi:hypothetical protein
MGVRVIFDWTEESLARVTRMLLEAGMRRGIAVDPDMAREFVALAHGFSCHEEMVATLPWRSVFPSSPTALAGRPVGLIPSSTIEGRFEGRLGEKVLWLRPGSGEYGPRVEVTRYADGDTFLVAMEGGNRGKPRVLGTRRLDRPCDVEMIAAIERLATQTLPSPEKVACLEADRQEAARMLRSAGFLIGRIEDGLTAWTKDLANGARWVVMHAEGQRYPDSADDPVLVSIQRPSATGEVWIFSAEAPSLSEALSSLSAGRFPDRIEDGVQMHGAWGEAPSLAVRFRRERDPAEERVGVVLPAPAAVSVTDPADDRVDGDQDVATGAEVFLSRLSMILSDSDNEQAVSSPMIHEVALKADPTRRMSW